MCGMFNQLPNAISELSGDDRDDGINTFFQTCK